MLTEKQLDIFKVFAKQPFAEFTRKQIKQLAGEKSNNALALAMKQFTKEGLIKEQKVGKSSPISLNLGNDAVHHYIALGNIQRMHKMTLRTMGIIKEELEKHTLFYSLVVFGSFAVQEQAKGSDLDVAVFIETEAKRDKIRAALNSAAQKSLLPVDAHVITKAEFIEMLTNDEENLGKQIARKHLVLLNQELFYGLVMEGMRRGFRI